MTDRDDGERPVSAYMLNALQELVQTLRLSDGMLLTQNSLEQSLLPEAVAAIVVGEVNTATQSGKDGQFLLVVKDQNNPYIPAHRELYVLQGGEVTLFTMEPQYSEENILSIKRYYEARLVWQRAFSRLPHERQEQEHERLKIAYKSIQDSIKTIQDLLDLKAAGDISKKEFNHRVEEMEVDYRFKDYESDFVDTYEEAYAGFILATHEYENVCTGLDRDMDCEIADIFDGDTPLSESTSRRTFGEGQAWGVLKILEDLHEKKARQAKLSDF